MLGVATPLLSPTNQRCINQSNMNGKDKKKLGPPPKRLSPSQLRAVRSAQKRAESESRARGRETPPVTARSKAAAKALPSLKKKKFTWSEKRPKLGPLPLPAVVKTDKDGKETYLRRTKRVK